MNKFEFLSLEEYPEGQYPTAIATVRVNHRDAQGNVSREILRFAKKSGKDGGVFWAMATHSVVSNGEKKYIPGFKLDSEFEKDLLDDFIKQSVKNFNMPKAQTANGIHYPHGIVQNSNHAPTSMSEVAAQEEIPF